MLLTRSELTETRRERICLSTDFPSLSGIFLPLASPLGLSHCSAQCCSRSWEELQEGEHRDLVPCMDPRSVVGISRCTRRRHQMKSQPQTPCLSWESEGINPQPHVLRPAPNPLAAEGQHYHLGKVSGDGSGQAPSLRLHLRNFICSLCCNGRGKERAPA